MISTRSKPTASTGKTRNQSTQGRTCSGCSICSVLTKHFVDFTTCYTPPSNLPSQMFRFLYPNPFKIKPASPSTVLVGRRLNGISCTLSSQPTALSRDTDLTKGWWRVKPVPRALPSQGSPAISAAADISLLGRLVLELQCRPCLWQAELQGELAALTTIHTLERNWFSTLLHIPGKTPQGDWVSEGLGSLG